MARSHRRTRIRRLFALLWAAASAGLCACGGGQDRSTVAVTMIAPTDGSAVAARSITVAGNVSPASATVLVDGRRAPVGGGSFKLALRLTKTLTRITIRATAPGYRGASRSLTVRYQAPPPGARTTLPAAGTSTSPVRVISTAEVARANQLCAARDRTGEALPPITPTTVASDAIKVNSLNAALLKRLRAIVDGYSGSEIATFVDQLGNDAARSAEIEADLAAHRVRVAARLFAAERQSETTLNSESGGIGIPACGITAFLLGGSGRE